MGDEQTGACSRSCSYYENYQKLNEAHKTVATRRDMVDASAVKVPHPSRCSIESIVSAQLNISLRL